MKAIILAGGFAKRMWPLTKDKPKHLLPIAKRPMLEYVLRELETIRGFNKVYLCVNSFFAPQFKEFLDKRKSIINIELVIEPVMKEEEKLGSVGALARLIKEKKINEPTLVIGGDNLFDTSIIGIMRHLEKYEENIVLLENINPKNASLYGIAVTDENDKITGFEEKPKKPKSYLAATACYVLTKKGTKGLTQYIKQGHDPDKMGHFIQWLAKNQKVYGFSFMGKWFDVGSIESYKEADKYFKKIQ